MQQAFDRDFLIVLHDVARMLRTRFDQRARATRHDAGPVGDPRPAVAPARHSQNEMAGICEVEPITVGRLVDRLEARGLVERRPDPRDRRINRLHLLPAAQPILEEIDAYQETICSDDCWSGLDEKRAHRAARCLAAHEKQSDRGRLNFRARRGWRRIRMAVSNTATRSEYAAAGDGCASAPGFIARLREDRAALRRVLMIGGVAARGARVACVLADGRPLCRRPTTRTFMPPS